MFGEKSWYVDDHVDGDGGDDAAAAAAAADVNCDAAQCVGRDQQQYYTLNPNHSVTAIHQTVI